MASNPIVMPSGLLAPNSTSWIVFFGETWPHHMWARTQHVVGFAISLKNPRSTASLLHLTPTHLESWRQKGRSLDMQIKTADAVDQNGLQRRRPGIFPGLWGEILSKQRMKEGGHLRWGLGRSKGHRYERSKKLLVAPGHTTSNKKPLITSASLLVTSALLVVTRSYERNKGASGAASDTRPNVRCKASPRSWIPHQSLMIPEECASQQNMRSTLFLVASCYY